MEKPRNAVEPSSVANLSAPSSWFYPALGYPEPLDVVRDDDLTHNEKRAILAAWASDACAVEAAPTLRRAPGSHSTVSIDDILEALKALDREARDNRIYVDWARRQVRRQTIESYRHRSELRATSG